MWYFCRMIMYALGMGLGVLHKYYYAIFVVNFILFMVLGEFCLCFGESCMCEIYFCV